MARKPFSLLLALLLLVCLPLSAAAATKGDGSIEVQVVYNGTKITGGELIAVRVGYLDEENAMFRQVTDHAEIKDIGKQSAVTAMLKFYNNNKDKVQFDVYTAKVKEGKALFEELPKGLFLIYQEKSAAGYNNLSPFLVTIPYDGKTDVTASSKTELKKEPNPTPTTGPTTPTGSKLPQTGQLTWPVPVLACCGMAFFVIGWWLCRRKDGYET